LLAMPLAWSQERRPWSAEKPAPQGDDSASIDPMTWERDFDLLLEVQNIPTKGQIMASARLEALTKERDTEQAKLDDVTKRLALLQGTYTTEALLNEVLRLDAKDFQSVQAKLQEEIRQHKKRLSEIDDQLKRLRPPTG
jgi:hypothetical protein